MLHVVKFSGPFGFIKPWTAVRDTETFSLQFLTPSIIEGITKKLFPEFLNYTAPPGVIARHRLRYNGMSTQKETVQAKAFSTIRKNKALETGIIDRGVMVEPELYLAFSEKQYAERAFTQHICLARNEDILLPVEKFEVSEEEFETIAGFELITEGEGSYFPVGYSRYGGEMEFGHLHIEGDPFGAE